MRGLLLLLFLVACTTEPTGELVIPRWITVCVAHNGGDTTCEQRRCLYHIDTRQWDCLNQPTRPCRPEGC